MKIINPKEIAHLKLYKITNKEEKHHGLQYKDGFNQDILEFKPVGNCSPGGMYFFDETKLHLFDDYCLNGIYWIREVTLLPDSKVYKENYTYKTDKFILGKRRNFKDFIVDMDEKFYLKCIKYGSIEYLPTLSNELNLLAVQSKWFNIEYIKNPSEEIQLEAVKQNGNAIEYIKNPSEKVQLAAVNQDGYVIKYIENPSEKVQLAAINNEFNAIKYIKNPTQKVRLTVEQYNVYLDYEPKLNVKKLRSGKHY